MNLPIPKFLSVRECYLHHADYPSHEVRVRFIAPDHMAGRRARYSVVELNLETGQATTIGRELPLKHSRKIAKTSPYEEV